MNKLGKLILGGSLLVAVPASAGGLFLPGSGAISTSRAGAAIASADDGEAMSVNPAGLAKTHGWTITISASLISYSMEFSRRGNYDFFTDDARAYEGTPFSTVKNRPEPPLGIGTFQPYPVVAIVSDLGGRVPNLHVAAGLYAPQGYPFRDMSGGYQIPASAEVNGEPNPALSERPPATRYDILKQESQLLLPTVAASYRILPQLDVGARFSVGRQKSKSTVMLHGTPGNVDEWVGYDTQFTAEVEDGFVPTFGIGVTYRPTPELELAAVYNSPTVIKAKGTAQSIKGIGVDPSRVVGPIPDDQVRCATGGTFEKQKACISLQLPMSATVGARYKLLDVDGKSLRGDIEVNLGWENWGKRCDYSLTPEGFPRERDCTSPGQFLVVSDSGLYNMDLVTFDRPVQINSVNLGLKDTFALRVGGSYHLPLGTGELASLNRIILRGGVGYDTAAAKDGWFRANFDGASRLTTTIGAAYRTQKWEINAGGGAILEGTNDNPGTCNATSSVLGCRGDGTQNPVEDRTGPDPTSPLLEPKDQFESPFNQGTIKSHYVMFMLGFSTWF